MRYLIGILVFCTWTLQAEALSLSTNKSSYADLMTGVVRNMIQPIIASRPKVEREILNTIEIVLIPNIRAPFIAAAKPGNKPKVVISDSFIYGLQTYAEAFLVEKSTGLDHFREWYFSYYLWRSYPVFEGGAPKHPSEWAKYNPSNPKEFQNNINLMVSGALIDMILHELGHHAENAFYSKNSSNSHKRLAESKADDWATRAGLQYIGDPNALGRFIAIAYIFEVEKWHRFSGMNDHPEASKRIYGAFKKVCQNILNPDLSSACQTIEAEIKTFTRSSVSEKEYRKRVQNGEGFANFPLGQILLKRSEYNEACKYFKKAHDKSEIPRALVYIGWCLEHGYLSSDTRLTDKEMAEMYYSIAAEKGFIDARGYLMHMKKN